MVPQCCDFALLRCYIVNSIFMCQFNQFLHLATHSDYLLSYIIHLGKLFPLCIYRCDQGKLPVCGRFFRNWTHIFLLLLLRIFVSSNENFSIGSKNVLFKFALFWVFIRHLGQLTIKYMRTPHYIQNQSIL